jgi:hypothetical protein
MYQYRIVFEDEKTYREIEILVDYILASGVVAIQSIRPTKVTIYDEATKTPRRTIKVYTEAGRQLLWQQYEATREGLPSLEDEIFAQHQLRDELQGQTAR